MGTIVSIDVPHRAASGRAASDVADCVARAFGWFHDVERLCSRFDPESELMRLGARHGVACQVSPTLFEAVRFAVAVAEATGGAFDPTIGARMERLGFNRDHRTRRLVATGIDASDDVTFRDVRIDEAARTITLERPMILDLGAVAKGMAIDLAARELDALEDFAIDAGGDLFLAGVNPDGAAWSAGIRHPDGGGRLATVRVSDAAVCTSGNYERRSESDPDARHLVDPRDGGVPGTLVSATVIASSAMLADALATAAFVLGPVEGRRLLDDHGVCGVLFSADLERIVTEGCGRDVVVMD